MGDVEGVGLFRTELLYLDRTDAPTFEEQVAAYTDVFAALPGRKVVVRDVGRRRRQAAAVPPAGGGAEPALGVRGLRISWKRPDVCRRSWKRSRRPRERRRPRCG
jgi:phosphotransferase system enzyme I (PtsI)